MHDALVLLIWGSLGGLVYTYLGYPLCVTLIAKSVRSKHKCSGELASHEELPSVTVLVAAHNAENHIRERIENILACTYPADRLTVVVASDACTDRTVEIVGSFADERVRVADYRQRRGKASTLSQAVQDLSSEVIVFTDATNRFEREAIHNLARHFVDPSIGVVSGEVKIVDEHGEPCESLYWRSELMVRRSEASVGVMLGASGAIYAIRRTQFVKPNRPIINDDLVLPMLSHLRHGCRVIYDESAKAIAHSVGGSIGEFRRRCRIGAGAFQCLPVLHELLQWRNAKQAFAFTSHKLLRWICPFLLMVLIASSIGLASEPRYRLLLQIQVAAYLLAIVGLFIPGQGIAARLPRVVSSFLLMNLALLTGYVRWAWNPSNVVWEPTPRAVVAMTERDKHMAAPTKKQK